VADDQDLVVLLHDRPVGAIRRAGRRSARFHPNVDGGELAVGAPAGAEPWTPDFTRAWFENLLPEEEPRARIAARFGLRPEDTWGLLERIGWECAGAVAVIPEGMDRPDGSYLPLDDEGVWNRLDELPARPLDGDSGVRMSLGGGQSKLLLTQRDGQWLLPQDGAPSTHILKPEPPYFQGLALAEAWALAIARGATLAADATVMVKEGHQPTLVVRRFDRTIDGDAIVRIHQEDACQALGLPPERKYADPPARRGQPSLVAIAALLTKRAADPVVELVRLLEQVTVNVAIGNTDAHAKNMSIFHDDDGTVRLTPAYDVSPTRPFIAQRYFALSIGGKFVLDDISRGHLVEEASTWGIPIDVAQGSVESTLNAMSRAIEAADAAFPAVRRDVRSLALDRLERLRAS
jgi:serine/threonine-protein kinase HipA